MEIRFLPLLAVKQKMDNRLYSLREVQEITGVDRRKLSSLMKLNDKEEFSDSDKVNLTIMESMTLCDWLGCKLGDLLYYEPKTPLGHGQQVQQVSQPVAVAA